jgi:hypothetical protein
MYVCIWTLSTILSRGCLVAFQKKAPFLLHNFPAPKRKGGCGGGVSMCVCGEKDPNLHTYLHAHFAWIQDPFIFWWPFFLFGKCALRLSLPASPPPSTRLHFDTISSRKARHPPRRVVSSSSEKTSPTPRTTNIILHPRLLLLPPPPLPPRSSRRRFDFALLLLASAVLRALLLPRAHIQQP